MSVIIPSTSQSAVETGGFNAAVEAGILARISDRFAHDCNNALAGILALGEEFQFQQGDGQPFPDGMKLFQENIMRTKRIVQRMVELQSKSGSKQHHDLNDLVVESVDLVRKFLPRTIQVDIEPATAALPVYVDAAAFRWMFIELAWLVTGADPKPGKWTYAISRNAAGQSHRIVMTLSVTGDIKLGNEDPASASSHIKPFLKRHGAVLSVGQRGASFQVMLPEADFTETEAA